MERMNLTLTKELIEYTPRNNITIITLQDKQTGELQISIKDNVRSDHKRIDEVVEGEH